MYNSTDKRIKKYSIGFVCIIIGLVEVFLLHFLAPGMQDNGVTIGYIFLIYGLLVTGFFWKEFWLPMALAVVNLVLSNIAYHILVQKELGLFRTLEFSNDMSGITWGVIICTIDMIIIILITLFLGAHGLREEDSRPLTDSSKMLLERSKKELFSDSRKMFLVLLIFVVAFIYRYYAPEIHIKDVSTAMWVDSFGALLAFGSIAMMVWYLSHMFSYSKELMQEYFDIHNGMGSSM